MKTNLPPKETYFYCASGSAPALIVCAKDYFNQIRESFLEAKESICICGWAFNLKTVMGDGLSLEEVLLAVPEHVKIRILIWDYIIFYMRDRDPFTPLEIALKNRGNIEFERFDFHPVLSSMHAKMVIVDSKRLFIGGIDLDLGRRDSRFNLRRDLVREEMDGKSYPPFRDYALRFDGDFCSRFTDLFNELWHSQKNQKSAIRSLPAANLGANLFFARTIPKYKGNPKDTSSFKLHKWLIQSARNYIYIENQYLTSDEIVDLLVENLKMPNGPEIVILVSYGHMPIIERVAMGSLLTKCVKKLLKNDPYSRLKIYTLRVDNKTPEQFVKVHSKCLLVDDRYLKIGSSNINNRSMAFDYELDALVKGREVAGFRRIIFNTLLGDGEEVQEEIGLEESIIATFEKAKSRFGKILEVKDILQERSPIEGLEEYLPLDKSEMSFFEKFGQRFLGRSTRRALSLKALGAVLVLILIIGGAFFVDTQTANTFLQKIASYFGVEKGIGLMSLFFFSYLILGTLFFPLNAYIFLCGAYFDSKEAFLLAMSGALGSSSLSYGIGRAFSSEIKADFRISKARALKQSLRKNSLKTLVFLRLVPIAPYALVNLVCGKFGIGYWKFLTATIIGLSPGSFVLIHMEKRLIDFAQFPEAKKFLVLIVLLGLLYLSVSYVKKRISP